MCGILGIATAAGNPARLDPVVIERMRDRMTHRGPDDAGLLIRGGIALAHRRLAVIDPTPAGHQPFASPDGRFALVYNGELYNDAELRRELAAEGAVFTTACDTETLLVALTRWGTSKTLRRLRGMYAFGLMDFNRQRLVIARDPLGIKPLYVWRGAIDASPALVFASEPRAILAHPQISARPDPVGMAGYVCTIRTTLGSRTLYDGVSTLLAGECIEIDLSGERPRESSSSWWDHAEPAQPAPVRGAVEDSVRVHLRTDVPLCCLLSGGLDSSIIARVARDELAAGLGGAAEPLVTYCSGAPREVQEHEGDLDYAPRVAEFLGVRHVQAPVARAMFLDRWRSIVERTGLPLSTPNEVAINEVARRMRADGRVVTLSGEGADELFGGYDTVLSAAWAFESRGRDGGLHPGEFLLALSSWNAPGTFAKIFQDPIASSLEHGAEIKRVYRGRFDELTGRLPAGEPLQGYMRFLRRVNLEGLLRRLDSATMLESVEGRTPFADADLCALAEAMPVSEKFSLTPMHTKIALRRAYAADLPPEVVKRPKASFPLPFQEWLAGGAGVLKGSPLVESFFRPEAVRAVADNPVRLWPLAWPMLNLALWGRGL